MLEKHALEKKKYHLSITCTYYNKKQKKLGHEISRTYDVYLNLYNINYHLSTNL